jgi:DNA-binding beta-propeller fold protein YncE
MYISEENNNKIYQYSTGTATTLDLSTGNYFSHTPSVNTLFAFSNAPASGTAAGFALALTGANAAETYDIANASYDSVSFSVAGQALLPTSFYISPDGLSLYVLDDGTNTAYQYSLSTAWDISSASYASKSFSAFSETTLTGIYFSSDGTKLYVTGFVSDAVSEYNLSTPWDISTASLSQSFSIFSQTSLPTGVFFSADGTKMFVSDTSADSIFKYVLSSAWDVSTASFSQSLSVTSEETNPQDIFFSPTGTKMFITGQNGVVIDEYSLSTAWDLSTATYSTSFSTSSQEPNLRGAFFKVDGSKMYVVGVDNDTIYQYTTGSTATATFTYPSSVKFPSGTAPAGPAIGETDVLVFYTDDGGTTYQGFRAGDAMA